MPTLTLQLLGHFHLALGGTPVTALSSPRLQSLVAYLALHSDAPQSRQHLAFLLWPDLPESNARSNLRQLLFELRHALPHPDRYLDVTSETIQWRTSASFTCDAAEFERTVSSGDRSSDRREMYTRALALYHGDLLPGCYDDWIAPERERLREQVAMVLEHLIQLLIEQRDYPAAISYAQQLLRHDPVREETYRQLMRLHALNEDRASALRTYHTCATVLHRELAVEPSPATCAEYERLLHLETQAHAPTVSLPSSSPLVGRQREWVQLQSEWREANGGRAHLVVLGGEAGIGKTRLAEELAAWVSRQGIPFASAHCYPAEGTPAFSPIVTWLRGRPIGWLDAVWTKELARLIPELARAHPEWRLGPLTEEWQRQRLYQAIVCALTPPTHPLLLLLDDLQWCDRDSLVFLGYLLHSQTHARLLVIGTLRVEELDLRHPLKQLLGALRQSGQLTEIELGPLDESETVSLATNVLGRAIEPLLGTRVYQETEGNPLFIVEMARAWSAGSHSLPPKVQAVAAARLAQLSPSARELADVAAVIGRDFGVAVLEKACETSTDMLVRGLDELWRRRIVREHGALAYDFTHAKLRDVIIASLGPAQLRALHRRVARALELVHGTELDTLCAGIAAHYAYAGDCESAIRYYERAALHARHLYANEEALGHYRRALELCQDRTPTDCVARLYEGLGDLYHWIGQYDQARDAYANAACGVPKQIIASARLQRKLGNTWREQYRYPEALQVYARAERLLGRVAADQSADWWHEWIQLQLESSLVRYWLGQVEQDDRLRQELADAVDQHGTPAQRAAYFQHMGNIEFRRNRNVATPRTVQLARAALAAHRDAGNDANIPAAQFMVGFHTLWAGNPEGAIEPLETSLELATRTGDASLQARWLTYLTVACRSLDQVEKTINYAERSLSMATALSMPEYIATAKANQAWVAHRRREPRIVQELGSAALELWRKLPQGHASAPFQWLALFPLIAVMVRGKRISKAIDYARALLDPLQQPLPDNLNSWLQRAICDWEGNVPKSAQMALQQALELAKQLHYL